MATRVLVLIKGLGRGGAERLLASAVPYLDTGRFRYAFAYLLPWKDALLPELRAAGFPVHCLHGDRGWGWVGRLRRQVAAGQIDLLHVHSPYVAVGARIGLDSRVPIVYTEHNVWDSYHPATRWANMLTYRRNDHVFAVSRRVHASIRVPAFLRGRGLPPIETLYHGLDPAAVAGWATAAAFPQELGIPEGAPVVVSVGNFRPDKGYRYLIGAAELVRRQVPDVRFVLVGIGPQEQEIRARVHAAHLDGSVVLAGFREDAPRLVAAGDVFALASTKEGLPVALLEAMALGTPAVVTSAGGIPEVVDDGKEALVVRPGDAPALARAIVSLLADPALRKRLGAGGRRRVAAFDIRNSVRRTEEVYGSLVG